MALDAFIFGVDGVLAETHEARREIYNEVFREAGLKWTWDRALYGQLLKSTAGGDLIRDYTQTYLSGWRQNKNASTMISAMKRRHASLLAERITSRQVGMRAGIIEFLRAAHCAGMRIAIVTNEDEATVIALLNTALSPTTASSFEIVTPAHVAPGTKLSMLHATALEIFGLSPRTCLVFESTARGLRSALAAKLPVVLTWGLYPELQECGEALLDRNRASLPPPSGAIVPRWDCLEPGDLLAHLREIHATQIRTCPPRLEKTLEAASAL
jgi:beta-phosphoglucomutase-like phosphatase (HAD superfamily)